jgi:arsenate reductase
VTKVLFVCVANGGRSVIAERIFNQLAAGRHEAGSAGSEPGAHAHAVVVEALGEIGIDASDHVPSVLDEATIQCDRADLSWQVETIWSDPGKPRTSWEFSDPKNRPIEEVRTIRNEIRGHVEELVRQLDADVATDRP